MRPLSLRRKFAISLVVFSLALTGGGGALALWVTTRALEAELDEKLLWMAGAVSESTLFAEDVLNFRPGEEGTLFWRNYQARLEGFLPRAEAAYLFRRGGDALVTTEPPDALPIGTPLLFLNVYRSELDAAWATGSATTSLFRGPEGELYKYAFWRLGEDDAMLALLVRTDFLDPIADLRQSLVLGALGGAGLAALLAWLLAMGIVQPLERLSRAALRIQRGQWDRPVPEEGADEVGRLSRAMERMREGILERDEQLRLMLAQVAHEIRNPLGGLELFASAAMESQDAEERRRILTRIRSEVDGLNGIIQNFLSFARPLEPQIELHDVRGPLAEAAELVRPDLLRTEDAYTETIPKTPLEVRADPDHVKRAVLNLLRNAAQAGGAVHLRARWRNGEVEITVSDTGPGIDPSLRGRIFEPFVTDKEQGAGLGLAIVRRLVERNGGRIALLDGDLALEARRELRGEGGIDATGAIFRIYLPGIDDLPLDSPPSLT
jgi:signal transduction histidine kinase